jgi:hemolysin activation/secretion protein
MHSGSSSCKRSVFQEQLARDRLSASPPAQIITQPESVSKDNGACRDIQTVHVDGASLFSPADLDRITQPYLQRCLGVGHIEALLSDITRAYVQKGWVGVRAYLPQQDLSEGRLKILVVEGKLSKIRVEDGAKQHFRGNHRSGPGRCAAQYP